MFRKCSKNCRLDKKNGSTRGRKVARHHIAVPYEKGRLSAGNNFPPDNCSLSNLFHTSYNQEQSLKNRHWISSSACIMEVDNLRCWVKPCGIRYVHALHARRPDFMSECWNAGRYTQGICLPPPMLNLLLVWNCSEWPGLVLKRYKSSYDFQLRLHENDYKPVCLS
jgi:hypothetical protein